MRLAVIGLGVVGRHMRADIERAGHTCLTYDIVGEGHATREEINTCDAAFVCVGTPATPQGTGGPERDRGRVRLWLDVPWRLSARRSRRERPISCPGPCFARSSSARALNPPYLAMRQPPFVILGGRLTYGARAADVFARLYNSECETILVDAVTAEVCKYAENYFLALKVTGQRVYDIRQAVGADFPAMMNAVTHDYRIGRSHTHVHPDRRGISTAAVCPRHGRAARAWAGRRALC